MSKTDNILFQKNDIIFRKNGVNNYSLCFFMENQNIYLANIINFDIVKILYQLNKDIYENMNLNKVNENEAYITFLMKNFFEDLGMTQKYVHLHMIKCNDTSSIIFQSTASENNVPREIPDECEMLSIEQFLINCILITPHKIQFECKIMFDIDLDIPVFVEKIIGVLINKIFVRVKEFIEKIE